MAVTSLVYGLSLQSAFNKEINFATDTVKCMLVTATYTPNQDTHRYKSSVTNEVTGTNYTAGGVVLANKTISYDPATNKLKLDADDVVFGNVTIAATRYAVFYVSTGTDATSPLLAYWDFGANQAPSASDFVLQLSTLGLYELTAA